tara:strand:+ start:906 stop:2975 length:2070 start_codon:yes stop_codon:yes gene_type:complete
MANYTDYKNAYNKSGQDKAGIEAEAAWNGKTPAQQDAMMKLLAKASKSKSTSSNVTTSTSTLNENSVKTMDRLLTLSGFQGDANQRNAEILEMTVEFLKKEGKLRKTIIQDLGQIGTAQKQTTMLIADASVEAALYGVNFDKVLETVSELSNVIGRNVGLTEDDVTRTAIFSEAMNVSLYSVSQMVKQFDMMNISVSGAIDKGNEMAEVARNMGVNMEGFMNIITDNMDMLNTYNFSDGVKGFAKMAAQSQRLGISMSTTAALAEKVMDPEGAIELAANLQVIGGAVGDLADPFKLMYMATNDVAGLQDALVNAGKDLVMFNEATGEMSIPPTAQRQMRAMAETLGMSKDEFAGMIKLQSKFDDVVNQMNFAAFTKEMEDSGVGDYIASIARMGEGTGKYQVSVDGMFKNVEDLKDTDLLELQKQAQIDEKNNAKSEKEIMLEQLTVLDAINNALGGVDAAAFAGGLKVEGFDPAAIGTKTSKAIVTGLKDSLPKLGDEIAGFMGDGIKSVFIGNDDTTIKWENIGEEIAAGLSGTLDGFITKIADSLGHFGDNYIDEAKKEKKGKKLGDFTISQGQTHAVITSKGMIIPSKKDTIIGVDLSASPTTPNMGAIDSTTTSNQTITLNTNKIEGSIDLKLDGRNLGKMTGREIVDAIFSNQTNANVLKEAIASINTKTAPGNINEKNSPFG